LRIVYLGTPAFAVPPLEAVLRAGHEVVTVVTQPDRPKGRRGEVAMPPVKECALKHNLPLLQPERVRRPEAVDRLRELAPELMIVVGYGQILPQSVIDIAPRGIVNVHASLLPKLRGAAPIQWAIVRDDWVTGVTTMQIDAGLDTGDMLLKESTPIGPDEDAVALGERLSHMGAELLIETIDGLAAGTITPQKQDSEQATYAPILKKEDGRIDWNKPANHIHNLVRGMQPWPGAHTTFRGKLLQIWFSRLVETVPEPRSRGSGALVATPEGLLVAAGEDTWLKLLEVQAEGRRRMSADEFARGQRLSENEKLGD
jgi:methionyl-tRNA formyltransferase